MMLVADTGGDDVQPAVAATPEIAQDLLGLRGRPAAVLKPRLKRPWVEGQASSRAQAAAEKALGRINHAQYHRVKIPILICGNTRGDVACSRRAAHTNAE